MGYARVEIDYGDEEELLRSEGYLDEEIEEMNGDYYGEIQDIIFNSLNSNNINIDIVTVNL